MSCYQTYGHEFMTHDLSHYLGAEFKGEWISQYVEPKPKPRMPLYHLVGAVDPIEDSDIEKRLNDLVAQLPEDSMARDFAKWPVSHVYPTTMGGGGGFRIIGPTATTWAGQVQALHDFLLARVTWMDSQLQ